MSKHFLVNPNIQYQDKEIVNRIIQEREVIFNDTFSLRRKEDISKLSEEDNLRHVEGRVVVKIDIDSKDSWTFENGQKIEYKRRFNNFNVRQTQPVNAIVISGEGISKGSEILVHPNSIHDSNRIFDYKDSNDNIRYFSIQNEMCFAWFDEEKNKWNGIYPYELALRVFKPYEGNISGIEAVKLKDTLFVLTGALKNKAVKTLDACDYIVVYQGRNGREENLIRFRPFGDEQTKREPEAIAILNDETQKVLSGKYLVGFTTSDAKQYISNGKDT